MFGRRMLILVAVLMGLTALAASVAPPPETARRQPGASPTPAPTTPPPPSTPEEDVVERIDAGATGPPQAIAAKEGEIVVLEVAGDVVDAVVIDGLDEMEAIDPESPARFEIYVDEPGSYPIRLLEADREVGVLDVG